MSTIAQLVSELTSAPAPVVFLDTCAILDVARATRAGPGGVVFAKQLCEFAGIGKVHLLIADIVHREWADNIGSAAKDADDAIETAQRVFRVAGAVGLPTDPLALAGFATVPTLLRSVSEQLRDACRVIGRDADAANAALDRVVAKRRPSHKKEVKDSYILEHCFGVAGRLVAAGYLLPMYFVSSNKADFASTDNTATIHPDLRSEFVAAGLTYATNIDAVVAQLRAGGHIP